MRQAIGSALRELALREPDALAVIDRERRLTRAQLQTAAARLARLLATRGVGQDDLVTVMLPNDAMHVIACCAIWTLGATPHPLSPLLPVSEQSEVVQLARSAAVLAADVALDGRFGGTEVVVLAGLEEALREDGGDPTGSDHERAAASWKASTSSGSTGRPKVVIAAGSAHVDPDLPVTGFLPLSAIQLVVAPLSHAAPFTYAMRGLMTGHNLVIEPSFDAAATLAAIATHRISWVMLAPTMMHRIRRLRAEVLASADLGSLETVVHIGAPIAEDLKRWWLDILGPERLIEVYSGSESSGLTVIRGDEWLQHPGSVGRAAAGTELRIVGEDRRPVAVGEAGLVELRKSAGAAYRYLGAESRVDEDGWDTLGDIGRLDADGYLWIIDRSVDRLSQDGSTFYPIEVEQAIERHPAVRSAVVTGRGAGVGDSVHAVVDIADSDTAVGELQAWLRAELPPQKRPRTIELVRAPVRDDAGKTRRSAFRQNERAEPGG